MVEDGTFLSLPAEHHDNIAVDGSLALLA